MFSLGRLEPPAASGRRHSDMVQTRVPRTYFVNWGVDSRHLTESKQFDRLREARTFFDSLDPKAYGSRAAEIKRFDKGGFYLENPTVVHARIV